MTKQFVLIILLTIAALFFRTELSHVLDGLVVVHNAIAGFLARVFSGNEVGRFIQDMIALLLIPFVIGGALGATFWLVKHEMMPNAMMVVWMVWVILLTTMIAQHTLRPSEHHNGKNSTVIEESES